MIYDRISAQKNIYGTDWTFPMAPDGAGRLRRISGLDNLRQGIRCWIETRLGETLYCRDKGIGLRDYIHQSAAVVAAKAPAAIELGLMKWEKRIKSVTAAATADELNRQVILAITYQPLGYGLPDTLTVPVQLARRA